jgi:hypothetical protein
MDNPCPGNSQPGKPIARSARHPTFAQDSVLRQPRCHGYVPDRRAAEDRGLRSWPARSRWQARTGPIWFLILQIGIMGPAPSQPALRHAAACTWSVMSSYSAAARLDHQILTNGPVPQPPVASPRGGGPEAPLLVPVQWHASTKVSYALIEGRENCVQEWTLDGGRLHAVHCGCCALTGYSGIHRRYPQGNGP